MASRLFSTGSRSTGLALACLVALTGPLFAAAPPTSAVEKPLFFDPDQPILPERARISTDAVKVFGLGFAPRTGSLASLAAYSASRHSQVNAWQIEDPMKGRYSRIYTGVSSVVANGFAADRSLGSALTALATSACAEYLDCWTHRDTDTLFAVPKRFLADIKDGRLGSAGTVEAGVYAAVVVQAHYTSDKAMQTGVRHDLTYTHLLENPAKYRGEVVRVRGHLFRINRYEPPWEADFAGVRDLYEAWIFAEAYGAQPYCVLFTVWPANLPKTLLGQSKIANPPLVTADGFFVKKYLYSAQGPTKEREAPMVIGHTIRAEVVVAPSSTSWVGNLLMVLVGLVLSVIGSVAVLLLWYRRNDARVRQRLALARSPEFIMPPPDAMPVAPVALPVGQSDIARAAVVPRFSIPPGLGDSGSSPGRQGDRGPAEDPPEDAGS